MRLATIAAHKFSVTLNVVATDLQLSTEVHDRLIDLSYLKSSCCKRFSEWCECGVAFNQFVSTKGLSRGVVSGETAEALLGECQQNMR